MSGAPPLPFLRRVAGAAGLLLLFAALSLFPGLLLEEPRLGVPHPLSVALVASGAAAGAFLGSFLGGWRSARWLALAPFLLVAAWTVLESAQGLVTGEGTVLEGLWFTALLGAVLLVTFRLTRRAPPAEGQARPSARDALVAACAAAVLLALLALPWASGEVVVVFIKMRTEPFTTMPGIRLWDGALAGMLALFAASLLAVAPRGRVPRLLGALALAGAALLSLAPHLADEVCAYELLASRCLVQPEAHAAPAAAAAVAALAAAFLLFFLRDGDRAA